MIRNLVRVILPLLVLAVVIGVTIGMDSSCLDQIVITF